MFILHISYKPLMIETNLQIDCFVTQNSILICPPLKKEKLGGIQISPDVSELLFGSQGK